MTAEEMITDIEINEYNVEFFGSKKKITCYLFYRNGNIHRGDGVGLIDAYVKAVSEYQKMERSI